VTMNQYTPAQFLDPASDGVEVNIIRAILARHRFYSPGKELQILNMEYALNQISIARYCNLFSHLPKTLQRAVRVELIRMMSRRKT
jgi:hypothetical protein